MSAPGKAAIVGGGVIGGGWAARFLLNGWDVAVTDPDPQAARKIADILANARKSLPALYDRPLPPEGLLSFHDDLAHAVADARWVQESAPERLDVKQALLDRISRAAPDDAVIGSSTSGFKPSDLNAGEGRAIVAHPFNPVYLLPLVELVGEAGSTARAADILRGLGMFPLTLSHEIDAHIADRLLEAVWRESLWLVKDGIATTEQVDDAIRMGFGLRWAQMGLFETYRLAGGEDGMRHFLAQFGPALKWPWTRLMDVPELDEALVARIAEQSDAQSGTRAVRELERARDDALVGILRSLRHGGQGAGGVIAAHEQTLPQPAPAELPVTVRRQIPPGWTDYNGHVNETHYLELGAQANDRLMESVGADAAYVAQGKSYFTVETHIRHLGELRAGEIVQVMTRVLGADGRKLHLFHRIEGPGERLVATAECLMLHIDLASRRSCPPDPGIATAVATLAADHARLPGPEGVGRHVGQSR